MTTAMHNTDISRCRMMVGAAGLTFAVASCLRPAGAQTARGSVALSPWVTIATDDTVAIKSPAAAMGQGSLTSLPLILAEELDADWSKVWVILALPNDDLDKNPDFGFMDTAASNAVTCYSKDLRRFGAQVRKVLVANAAKHWNVPVSELTTGPNVVIHAQSGWRLSYGEIAAFAEVPAQAPDVTEDELKTPATFRLIGKDVMPVEPPGKVNGTAPHAIVQVPGMLYGAILRTPIEGAGPDRIDDSKAKAVGGLVRIVAPDSHPLDDIRLRRVLDYISANIENNISLVDLAGIAAYSPFHFARKFNLAMGIPPHRYLSRVRLEKAMAELAAGKLPIAVIALNAHFSSQASFTRAFHRATGMTPKQYRCRRL